tara:strand:- start:928 stop:1374 length:447 start_codon:yes stop_codon:yes gene_type:complete
MTNGSGSIRFIQFITGVAWFVFGVVMTVVLYPMFTGDFSSERITVNTLNQSGSECWVLVEDSLGKTQGNLVGAQESATIPVFEGEFTDHDFPKNVQITVLAEDFRVLDTRSFETTIEVENGKISQLMDLQIALDSDDLLAVTYSEVSP